MRKNTQQVFQAWRNGQPKSFPSISTDGKVIKSYSTIILERCADTIVLNPSNYSPTTTRQQNGLKRLLTENGMKFTVGD